MDHLASRRSVLKSLLSCWCVVSARAATAMSSPLQGPPWQAEVASSRTISVGGAAIQIDFAPGDLDLPPDKLIRWIRTAADSVSAYYGRFPVARARILVVPIAARAGVMAGTTWGGVGGYQGFTRIRLGQHTTEDVLANDWVMTHELVHMALPSLPEDQHWLEEGLATYLEPIARERNGTLSAIAVWGEMVRNMAKGEPQRQDQGLNHTRSWASTYWGGALFYLVADVTIRKQTDNRKGLRDGLIAILAAHGAIDQDWPLSKVLRIADEGTGTAVLETLNGTMGDKAGYVDLDSLWQELGVVVSDGAIHFDDSAPFAKIRHAITGSARSTESLEKK